MGLCSSQKSGLAARFRAGVRHTDSTCDRLAPKPRSGATYAISRSSLLLQLAPVWHARLSDRYVLKSGTKHNGYAHLSAPVKNGRCQIDCVVGWVHDVQVTTSRHFSFRISSDASTVSPKQNHSGQSSQNRRRKSLTAVPNRGI
jgi:hypothetical protein